MLARLRGKSGACFQRKLHLVNVRPQRNHASGGRHGTQTEIRAPLPGADRTAERPPSSFTRSTRNKSPQPRALQRLAVESAPVIAHHGADSAAFFTKGYRNLRGLRILRGIP